MTLPEKLPEGDRAFPEDQGRPLELQALVRLEAKLGYLPDEQRTLVRDAASYLMRKFTDAGVPDRDSGRPASCHSIDTAGILADLRLPAPALQMGLLHDVVEDASKSQEEATVNLAEIRHLFGNEIAEGVDKLGIIKQYGHENSKPGVRDDETRDQELRARFFEAIIHKPLVAFVRLAERLQNLSEIAPRYKKYPESALRTCEETIAVYAPAAWEMGLYEMAQEMAIRSLAVLFPEKIRIKEKKGKIIDVKVDNFPAFSSQQIRKVTRLLGTVADLSEDVLFMYPPNAKMFGELLLARRNIEMIQPGEAPMLADLIVEDIEQAGSIVFKLLCSGWFYLDGLSWDQLGADIAYKGDLPLYITLIPKERKGKVPTPVRLAFFTLLQRKQRQASITDLYKVDGCEDEDTRQAAQRQVDSMVSRLAVARQKAPEGPARGEVYIREVKGEAVPVTVQVREKRYECLVSKGSTILDALLEALPFEEVIHCSVVKKDGKEAALHWSISQLAHLSVETGKIPEITPYWLAALKRSGKGVELTAVLRDIITGKYPTSRYNKELLEEFSQYQEKVRQLAVRRGRERLRKAAKIEGEFSVKRGFDQKLLEKYGSDYDRFYIDVGIESLSDEIIAGVVERLGQFLYRLPKIKVYIPHDQPGIAAICDNVLANLRINIIRFAGGETDESDIESVLTYGVETEDETRIPELLQQVKEMIMAKSAKELKLKAPLRVVTEVK